MLCFGRTAAWGGTVTWNVDASGDWSTTTDWTGNALPMALDDVMIDRPAGVYTITHSSGVDSVNSLISNENVTMSGGTLSMAAASTISGVLTLSGGTLAGAGDLTLAGGGSTWTGGTMSGTGNTVISTAGTMTAGSASSNMTLTLGRVLEVAGSVTLVSGSGGTTLNLTGGTVSILSAGTFAFNNSGTVSVNNTSGTNAFNNAGTFNKNGTGTAIVNVPFNNAGTVNVTGGILSIASGGLHSGPFNLNGGAISLNGVDTFEATSTIAGTWYMDWTGGTHTFNGTVNLGGDLGAYAGVATFNAAVAVARLQLNGGTAIFNAPTTITDTIGTTNLSSGTVSGSGTLTFNGPTKWTGGTMSGTGKTIVAATGSLAITAGGQELARTIDNAGTATLTGTGNWNFKGGTFNNLAEATFTATSDVTFASPSGTNAFNNAGTFNKTGNTTLISNVPFNNTGTVNVQGGTLSLKGGGTDTSAFLLGLATLQFSGGTHTLNAGATVSGGGSVIFSGGTTTLADAYTIAGYTNISGGTATFNAAASTGGALMVSNGTATFNASATAGSLSLSSNGVVAGTGTLTVAGLVTWSPNGTMSGTGKTTLAPTAVTTFTGGSLARVLDNGGVFNYDNSNSFSFNGGTFNNLAGATFNASGGGSLSGASGTNAFNNTGTFNKAGNNTFTSTLPFNNTGTVSVQGGTLALSAGGNHSGPFSLGLATLQFSGGSHVLNTGATVSGDGSVIFSGGTIALKDTYSVPEGYTNIAGADVTFDAPSTTGGSLIISSGTARFNASASAGGLNFSNGTLGGTGDVTIGDFGTSQWTGGTMAGTGKTVIPAGAAMTLGWTAVNNTTETLGRVLEIGGTLSLISSTVSSSYQNNLNLTGGTISVLAGGTMNLANTFGQLNVNNTSGTNAINNAGTVTKTGTTTATVNVPLNNTGSVSVQQGTLTLTGGGVGTGSFNIATGSTAQFFSGTYSFDAGSSLAGDGTALVHNAADVSFNAPFTAPSLMLARAGSGTISANAAVGIGGLSLSSGTLAGSGDLTLGTLSSTWTGGTMSGTGKTIVPAGATMTLGSQASVTTTETLGRILEVGGTLSLISSNSGSFQNNIKMTGGTVNVLPGGTLNLANTFGQLNVDNISGANAINNAGTLTKTGTTTATVNVPLNNTGTVSVQQGTLYLSGGGSGTGSFNVAAGATAQFFSGTYNFDAGSSLAGGGTALVSSATVSLNSPFAAPGVALAQTGSGTVLVNAAVAIGGLSLSSGTLAGSGDLTLGTLSSTWTGGTMSGTGKTIIPVGATMALGSAASSTTTETLGRVLEVAGTLSLISSNSGSFQNNIKMTDGTVSVLAGGTLNLANTFGQLNVNNISGTNAINNAGTLTKSGTTTATVNVPLNNTGTVSVQQGTLTLTGGIAQHSGATLIGGTWTVSNGATLNVTTGSNITTLGPSAALTLDGASSSFGKINTLANNQGSFTIQNGRNFTTAGAFANSGTLTVGPSSTFSMGAVNPYTQTTGSTVLSGGTLSAPGGGVNIQGGNLAGTGTVTGNATVGGTLSPGSGTATGTISFVNGLTLGGTATSAFKIGGTTAGSTYDQVAVGGTAILGGSLSLSFVNGFVPAAGQSFAVLTSASPIAGSFANASDNSRFTVPGGKMLVSYAGNAVTLSDLNAVRWNVDADGQWTTASNWTGNSLPTATDDVTIDRPAGTYTVTLSSGTQSVNSLVSNENLAVSGGTLNVASASSVNGSFALTGGTLGGAGDLTLNGTNTWSAGTMASGGKTKVTVGASLAVTAAGTTLSRSLDNAGAVTLDGTGGWTFAGGTFNNLAGASFAATTASTLGAGGGTNAFNNSGVFSKSGSGVTMVSIPFNNGGAINITGGTLSLWGGGSHIGTVTVNDGPQAIGGLSLSGNHTFAASSPISGNGYLDFFPGSFILDGPVTLGNAIVFRGGTSTFNSTVQAYQMQFIGGSATFNSNTTIGTGANNTFGSGTLTGSGTVNLAGILPWTAGTITGSGKLIIAQGGALSIGAAGTKTLGRTVENSGTVNWTDGQVNLVGTAFKNFGTFNATSQGPFFLATSGTNLFENSGTFNRIGGTTFTSSAFGRGGGALTFNNLGVVNVSGAGSLYLDADGTHTGTFNLASDPVGTGVTFVGNHVLTASSSIVGSGPDSYVDMFAGSHTFAGPISVGLLAVRGGTNLFSGNVSTNNLWFDTGSSTINGAVTAGPDAGSASGTSRMLGGTLTGSGTLTLNGTFTWSGGTMAGSGHTIVGINGALAITANGTTTLSRNLDNGGSTVVSGDGNLAFNSGAFSNLAGGTFTISTAATIASSAGTNAFSNAGIFKKTGTGTATVSTSFSNTGTVVVQGGTLAYTGTVAQLNGSDLTGGTWSVSDGTTLSLPGPDIETLGLGATVMLDGTTSAFPKLAGLRTVAGALALTGGRSFTAQGYFASTGNLIIGTGASLNVPNVTTTDLSGSIGLAGALTAQSVRVGSPGVGTLTQTGGSMALTNTLYLGNAAGDTGIYNLSGGSIFTPYLVVGSGGTGSFVQTGGSVSITQRLHVALVPGSTGTYSLAGGSLTAVELSNHGSVALSSGTAALGSVTGGGSLSISGNAVLTAAGPLHQSSLVIDGQGLVTQAAGSGTSRFATLSVTGTGVLDLADNPIIIDLADPATVRSYLLAGYHGGAWDGTGGITSATAAADPQHRTGIAYAPANVLLDIAGSQTVDWEGEPVSATALLLKHTYFGDANFDGQVNADDYVLTDRGRLKGITGWVNGDFNYDGTVDQGDYLLIDRSFALQTGGLSPSLLAERSAQFGPEYVTALVTSVPEPSSLVGMVAVVLLGATRHRKRR